MTGVFGNLGIDPFYAFLILLILQVALLVVLVLVYDLSLIHISEPTRRTPISYAVFCLKKKKKNHRLPSFANIP